MWEPCNKKYRSDVNVTHNGRELTGLMSMLHMIVENFWVKVTHDSRELTGLMSMLHDSRELTGPMLMLHMIVENFQV